MATIQTTRTIPAPSEAALAALRQSEVHLAEIEQVRAVMAARMSELAAKRADAIRSALEAGMTQADVGRVLGISGQAVYNILRQH